MTGAAQYAGPITSANLQPGIPLRLQRRCEKLAFAGGGTGGCTVERLLRCSTAPCGDSSDRKVPMTHRMRGETPRPRVVVMPHNDPVRRGRVAYSVPWPGDSRSPQRGPPDTGGLRVMERSDSPPVEPHAQTPGRRPHRWPALAVIGVAQLMVVLDTPPSSTSRCRPRSTIWVSARTAGSGSSPPTRWLSAACCSSADGSPTSPGAAGHS